MKQKLGEQVFADYQAYSNARSRFPQTEEEMANANPIAVAEIILEMLGHLSKVKQSGVIIKNIDNDYNYVSQLVIGIIPMLEQINPPGALLARKRLGIITAGKLTGNKEMLRKLSPQPEQSNNNARVNSKPKQPSKKEQKTKSNYDLSNQELYRKAESFAGVALLDLIEFLSFVDPEDRRKGTRLYDITDYKKKDELKHKLAGCLCALYNGQFIKNIYIIEERDRLALFRNYDIEKDMIDALMNTVDCVKGRRKVLFFGDYRPSKITFLPHMFDPKKIEAVAGKYFKVFERDALAILEAEKQKEEQVNENPKRSKAITIGAHKSNMFDSLDQAKKPPSPQEVYQERAVDSYGC